MKTILILLLLIAPAAAFAQQPDQPLSTEQQTMLDWNAVEGTVTALNGTVAHLRTDIQKLLQELRMAKQIHPPPINPIVTVPKR